jgi:SAM-dependent methyltransferase
MRSADHPQDPSYSSDIKDFFDDQYRNHPRYWWRGGNRYSLNPGDHTPFNSAVLRVASGRPPGRALDIGAGEGADSIRLARRGYTVDALEMSAVACEKIERFARTERLAVDVLNESILSATLSSKTYDLVVMNGLLHYIKEKEETLGKVRDASTDQAVHIISLFSTITPIPQEHKIVPVFPDDEEGIVESAYMRDWPLVLTYERGKPERSHPGFSGHIHSYIKMIVALSRDKRGE